jgi:pimeloyl-ACP methyl ester carboxylesterase
MLDEKINSIEGNWKGSLKVAGTELPISFLINYDLKESLTASLISQGQTIKADIITNENQELTIKFDKINGKFQGKFDRSNSTIMGIWTQGNQDFELKLQKGELPQDKPRPQELDKPYPYLEKEVKYQNKRANIILGGTLTYPSKEPPYPATILISGSGAEDRDETIFGHKPFLVLADYLTRRGISVLRVDDRGVGASTGIYMEATNADFASDVKAGIDFLKKQKEINPKKIGLIGHSEGGVIAPIVASNNSDVAFIVLMAGPGLTLEEILYMQGELIAKANEVSEELISKQRRIQEIMFSIIKKEKKLEIAEQKIRKAVSDELKQMKEKNLPSSSQNSIDAQIKMVLSPWFRDFLTYDPKTALSKVKCPVLAINGEKDLQVPPKENLAAIEQALKEGGNNNYQIIELPSLNHLFQTAKTGAITEYAQIEETISQKALEVIGNWLIEQLQK